MNIINACAKYTGYEESIKALRFEITGKGKNSATPLFVIYSFAAQETSANPTAFEIGSNVLITGRLHRRLVNKKDQKEGGKIQKEVDPEDGRMYVVPTQELQITHPNCELNQVQLAGAVGWRGDLKVLPRGNGVINFGLLCQASKQRQLNHDWNDSVPFKIEAWGEESKRFDKHIYVGRSLALGGALKFDCWTAKDGSKQGGYKVSAKNAQHALFGKSQKTEEKTETATTPAVEVTKDADDGIPF